MLDKTKMDRFEKYGGAAAVAFRDELGAALQGSIAACVDAVNAYFADVARKRETIAARVANLRAEHSRISDEISSFAPALADATITGDNTALDSIQAKLTELEASKAAVAAQIELLAKVSVKGDAAAFDAANKQAEALEHAYKDIHADMNEFLLFAHKQIELWQKAANFASVGGDTIPLQSVRARIEEMRQDFQGGSEE